MQCSVLFLFGAFFSYLDFIYDDSSPCMLSRVVHLEGRDFVSCMFLIFSRVTRQRDYMFSSVLSCDCIRLLSSCQ